MRNSSSDIISFLSGRTFFAITSALMLISLAASTGSFSIDGFLVNIVDGYRGFISSVYGILFGWVKIDGFELSVLEREATALITFYTIALNRGLENPILRNLTRVFIYSIIFSLIYGFSLGFIDADNYLLRLDFVETVIGLFVVGFSAIAIWAQIRYRAFSTQPDIPFRSYVISSWLSYATFFLGAAAIIFILINNGLVSVLQADS